MKRLAPILIFTLAFATAGPRPARGADAAPPPELAEAEALLAKGDVDAAVEAAKKGLGADENNVDLHACLAKLLVKKGNAIRAKEELDFVARKGKLTPELDGFLKDLAKAGRAKYEEWGPLKTAGDANKAQTVLFDAFNLCPALAGEHFKELKEGYAFWKEQADKTPNGGTLYRAAYLAELSGDNDVASEYYALMLDHITDKINLACVVDRAANLGGGGGRHRMTKADIEAEVEKRCKGKSEEEKKQVRQYIEEQASYTDRMESAATQEEKDAILQEALGNFKSRANAGSLPPAVQKMLDEESQKTGKTLDQLIEEQGLQ